MQVTKNLLVYTKVDRNPEKKVKRKNKKKDDWVKDEVGSNVEEVPILATEKIDVTRFTIEGTCNVVLSDPIIRNTFDLQKRPQLIYEHQDRFILMKGFLLGNMRGVSLNKS